MKKIASLKAQAKNLKSALAAMGVTLTQAQALEAIAKQYGMENWDTLSGILSKLDTARRTPQIGDMPSTPTEVTVENGLYSQQYSVDHWAPAIRFVHDETVLQEYVQARPDNYPDGMDSEALCLSHPDGDRYFSFRDLAGMKYADVGMGNWELEDGKTYLRFGWVPELDTERVHGLCIPDSVKSVKGVQTVVLCSHDGAQYDHRVLVPPHMNAKDVARKFEDEIKRLKALDAYHEANPDVDPNFEEYTLKDLRKFALSIGCVIPEDSEVVSVNWD